MTLLALEKGLQTSTARAWTGFNYDGTDWVWSDDSPTLGYSNWFTVPTNPGTFSKAQLLFNKIEPDFGKWKAHRAGNDVNMLLCTKPEDPVCCEDVRYMRDFSLEKNKGV